MGFNQIKNLSKKNTNFIIYQFFSEIKLLPKNNIRCRDSSFQTIFRSFSTAKTQKYWTIRNLSSRAFRQYLQIVNSKQTKMCSEGFKARVVDYSTMISISPSVVRQQNNIIGKLAGDIMIYRWIWHRIKKLNWGFDCTCRGKSSHDLSFDR